MLIQSCKIEATNEWLLDCSYCIVSVCLLYRDKRMKAEEFTYLLVGFVVVYLAIQTLMAYFGGYL